LSEGSWLHEKPCQFDVTPRVVNAAADGPGVGDAGSREGELTEGEFTEGEFTEGEFTEGETNALVIGEGEATAAVQPPTRLAAASPTAKLLSQLSRGL
jgi:hypothetical protein